MATPKTKKATKPKQIGFTAPLVEGHQGVHAVIVPFDPREVWGTEPVALDPRRSGWLVRGTIDGAAMFGWIGVRWSRYFIIVDAALRTGVAVGDELDIVVEPTGDPRALAIAQAQAKLTTAPGRGKARARKPPATKPAR
jgi:hypothetical protein